MEKQMTPVGWSREDSENMYAALRKQQQSVAN